MTYRLDSDIPSPHGWFQEKGTSLQGPFRTQNLIKWGAFNETSFEWKMTNNADYQVFLIDHA